MDSYIRQINSPITEVITITIATTTLNPPNWGFSKMDEFVTLDSDPSPLSWGYVKQYYLIVLKIT